MLRELSIHNFAIIGDLRIRFAPGLTILSGETGAGKSILIMAVNLLLGSRASAAMVRSGCEFAELEALFDVAPQSETARMLEAAGYASTEGLLIRRVLSRIDTNRLYVNGRLATMQLLGAITENLAGISGQHAHQSLLREDQHLLILDQFGKLLPLRQAVSDTYHAVLPLIEKIERLHTTKEQRARQVEFLRFQRAEIDSAGLLEAEDTHLEQERQRLKHSALLFQTVNQAVDEIYSSHGSVADRLTEVRKNIEKAERIDSTLAAGVGHLSQIDFLIEELVDHLRGYLNTIEMDEGRLETVEKRLDLVNKLKRKYGGSIEDINAHREAVACELAEVENVDEQISLANKQLAGQHGHLAELALNLSRQRQETAAKLAQAVEAELKNLKMAQTRFRIELQAVPSSEKTSAFLRIDGMQVFESGLDRAVFKISPNIGEELKSLTAIASGGELSRLVLALKSILSHHRCRRNAHLRRGRCRHRRRHGGCRGPKAPRSLHAPSGHLHHPPASNRQIRRPPFQYFKENRQGPNVDGHSGIG